MIAREAARDWMPIPLASKETDFWNKLCHYQVVWLPIPVLTTKSVKSTLSESIGVP